MNIEETYLGLLRQALFGRPTPALPQREGEWAEGLMGEEVQAVMALAERQGTGALIANEVLKRPTQALPHREGCVEEERSRVRLQMLCAQVMMGQERQRRALEEVWRAIEGTGVKPVLLKGFGLAQLYPLPYLRQWGDADIWVGHGHYDEVTEAICKTMEVTWHHESEEENERHYNFNTKDGFVFEIHPQTIRWVLPKEDRIYRAIEAKAMEECETIEIEGTKYRVPERGFNQLFVFLHAWEHCTSSGTNMKQLSDLALLCQRERLPKELYEVLKPLHMLEPWEVMGYVVVKAFGIEKDRWTGYSERPRIRKYGERLYREILGPLRCQTANAGCPQNKILRKIGTLMTRIEKGREIKRYCPKYGRHYVWMAIVKGVRRNYTDVRGNRAKVRGTGLPK